MIATDLSQPALAHARRNLTTPHVYAGDVYGGLPAEFARRVDVITAVPPYVPAHALDEMPREARDHEPTAALTSGDPTASTPPARSWRRPRPGCRRPESSCWR